MFKSNLHTVSRLIIYCSCGTRRGRAPITTEPRESRHPGCTVSRPLRVNSSEQDHRPTEPEQRSIMVPMNPAPDEGDDGDEDRDPAEVDESSKQRSDAGFRWECPICGMTRVNTMSRQGSTALQALKRHINGAEGDGHGPRDSYPDDIVIAQLHRYVQPVDD